ncbi:amidase signature domain-containing protein [Lasiosphaeris hirsuta]|uniref:Amidase signature domain-containing protein n=1 Tax=Lasiosphaeris hirsuta TaxID=260670 RepID=A0AA40B9L5_9PEZI|nr:amidase signature domain-containing protein [Lasiosphaeris hirsuta]
MIVPVGKHRYVLVDSGLRLVEPSGVLKHHPKPVLLFSSEDCKLEPAAILRQVQQFHEEDDVFDEAFVSDTLLVTDQSREKDGVIDEIFASDTLLVADESHLAERAMLLRTELADEMVLGGKKWHLDSVYYVDTSRAVSRGGVASGPYFLKGDVVFHAWKIYTDIFSCFGTTVLPTWKPYRFKSFNRTGSNGIGMSVAVPSRRYARPSPAKPLAGFRVGVKDNFRLAGTKSSVGNRAFLETYGQDAETAAFIKRLIDLGAVIVGKTKMTAFASGEKPIDWFDFQCPFNPRGDAHLEPGASSTGSAAAAAAYPWMDICIGTDTNGSVREPAARCGVYGIRCSTGAWGPATGLYPCSPVFDTVGAFGRSLECLQSFAKAALGSTIKEFRTDGEQQQLVDKFIHFVESFLGVKKTSFSLAKRWAENPPDEAGGKSLADYAEKSGYNPFYFDIYHEYDTFRSDHLKKFGSKAYVSPSMQWRWDRGAEITKTEVEQSCRELKVLESWFAREVLRTDKASGSSAILILPVGPTEPNYRDVYSLPGPRLGIDALSLASIMRMPQLVVPIGQVDYESRVSGRKESFPVSSSIAGAHGSDLMLIDLARRALENAKFPTQVTTGRYAFDAEERAPSI